MEYQSSSRWTFQHLGLFSVLSPDLILLQEVAAGQYLGTGGCTMVGQLVPILQVRQSSSQTKNNTECLSDVRCQYYYKQSERWIRIWKESLDWIYIYFYYKQTSFVVVLLFLGHFIFEKMKAFQDQSLLFKLFDIRVQTFLTILSLPWFVSLREWDTPPWQSCSGWIFTTASSSPGLSSISYQPSSVSRTFPGDIAVRICGNILMEKYLEKLISLQEMSGTLSTVTRETLLWRRASMPKLTLVKHLLRSTGSKYSPLC